MWSLSLAFSPFAMAILLALPLVDINWTNLVYNFVYPIYHCGELPNLVTCTIGRWSWQIFDLVFPNCYATALGRRPLRRPLSAFPALCAVRREQIPLEPALHACLCLLSSLYNVIIWPTITGCRWVFLPWLHTYDCSVLPYNLEQYLFYIDSLFSGCNSEGVWPLPSDPIMIL